MHAMGSCIPPLVAVIVRQSRRIKYERHAVFLFSSVFLRMSQDLEHADEQTRLLPHLTVERRPGLQKPDEEVGSTSSPSYLNRGGHRRFSTPTEDSLPYNSFVTVDLLRDLVQ